MVNTDGQQNECHEMALKRNHICYQYFVGHIGPILGTARHQAPTMCMQMHGYQTITRVFQTRDSIETRIECKSQNYPSLTENSLPLAGNDLARVLVWRASEVCRAEFSPRMGTCLTIDGEWPPLSGDWLFKEQEVEEL
jgi:hypothetical protein